MVRHFPAWRPDGAELQQSGSLPARRSCLQQDPGLGFLPIARLLSQARGMEQQQQQQQSLVDKAPSMFQTGTGKSVQVSAAAMKRALALFDADGISPRKRLSTERGASPEVQSVEKENQQGLFRTATGKPMETSASALAKARALLQDGHQGRHQPSKKPTFKHPRRLGFTPLKVHRPAGSQQASRSRSAGSREVSGPLDIKSLKLNIPPPVKRMEMPVRMSLRDYVLQQQHSQHDGYISPGVRSMSSDSARHYSFNVGGQRLAAPGFQRLLLEAGAKADAASTDWVENHYRWIVWKLASLQRRFPRSAHNFLTINNVLTELKYRYAREFLFGHRSAIKRICERDSSASVTMVLCVAAVRTKSDVTKEPGRIEVTDGWYSLNAILDEPLNRQLRAGKLFVGQKLRVSGAVLVGVLEGLPPLEAANVASLVLHANSTYRVHWAERLGICKAPPLPLSLRCVKQDGGPVRLTCVALTRIYPLLYMERLPDGRSVSRSLRGEQIVQQSFEERQARAAEALALKMEKEPFWDDRTEGARLYRLLELAGDPEVMMADMTSEQHAALLAYQVRRKAAAETNVQKALEDANLHSRDVTPILKVRVVNLQSTGQRLSIPREGLITIWAPTDTLVSDLTEGGGYLVSFLRAHSGGCDPLLRLCTTKLSRWRRLSTPLHSTFRPRSAASLSTLSKVSTNSEFDMAAVVLHVGDIRICGPTSTQWVFVADGSCPLDAEHPSLLAIEFSAPVDAHLNFDSALTDAVVGFCNLVKREPDDRNCMLRARASELSTYSTKMSSRSFCHLGNNAALSTRWARSLPEVVAQLRHFVQGLVAT